jgi:hypothetical protein
VGWVEGWNLFPNLMSQDSTFTPSSEIRVEGFNQIPNPTQKLMFLQVVRVGDVFL